MIPYLDLKRINAQYVDELNKALSTVANSGRYLQGEAVSLFEKHYAAYIGTRHCIGCGNGLDALTLILRAYIALGEMQPGDEIIVPANTFIASILAISAAGLIPRLVEPTLDTLQIDDTRIAEAINTRTRGLMIVHLYGRCAYTEHIRKLCNQHHLRLIEDNAQAHGCRYAKRRTGSLGDASGHSFYPGKNLGALGDSGAVTTDDDQLAETIRSLGNYGSSSKYIYPFRGINSRLDELQAAVLDVKLRYLDEANNRRRRLAEQYIACIHNTHLRIPNSPSDCVYHIFPVFSTRRDDLRKYLSACEIETLIHYPVPPHKQSCYARLSHLSLPITEQIHREELSLPLHPALTNEETNHIIDAVNAFR